MNYSIKVLTIADVVTCCRPQLDDGHVLSLMRSWPHPPSKPKRSGGLPSFLFRPRENLFVEEKKQKLVMVVFGRTWSQVAVMRESKGDESEWADK